MAYKNAECSDRWFDWEDKEVDSSYPVNEELQCNDFLSYSQQCVESVATSVVALLALLYAYPRLKLPETSASACQKLDQASKRILLLLLCLAFGIELGVSLASRRMFWIGKPGHLATMLQIFILAAPPNRIVTAAFRLQMHMLIGIPLVIFSPVTKMHLSLFETGINFIHHLLMLGNTFYLMHIGDPYIPEPLGDFSWALIAYVILFLYHFLPLQLLAYVSKVSLNSILYPDSYFGNQSKLFRLLVFFHQIILIPIFGKLMVIVAKTFKILPCDNSLDKSATVCEPSHPSRHSSSSVDVHKQGSAPGSVVDCNTDEDSGCGHSWNMVSKGCRKCSSKKPHSSCWSCSYRPSCHRFCPHRSCLHCDKGFDWCSSPESVHTKRIVNGKLVDGVKIDEAPYKRRGEDKTSNMQKKSAPAGGSNKITEYRGFILDDTLDSSPEAPVERTAPASDHESSRKSYAY